MENETLTQTDIIWNFIYDMFGLNIPNKKCFYDNDNIEYFGEWRYNMKMEKESHIIKMEILCTTELGKTICIMVMVWNTMKTETYLIAAVGIIIDEPEMACITASMGQNMTGMVHMKKI